MTTTIAELKQKSKLPANRAGGSTVAQFFESNKNALAAVLPKHVTPDRMLKIALSAIRSVPQLLECTTESLFGAVVQCAQLGIEPNTPLGHAYMIPFRNRKENRTDVQMIIGYKGLLDLARRSGQIISIAAHAVREKDQFDFAYGLTEELTHRPAIGDRGEIIAFYAVAQLTGGGHAYEVMSRDDVNKIRASSQSRGQWGPWKDHYEEMGRKTAIRRLAKYLPLSIEFANAVALDSVAASDQSQNLDAVLDGDFVISEPYAPVPQQEDPAETKEKFEYEISDPEEFPGTTMPPAEEWPREIPDENGEVRWADSSGAFFDENLHAWSARENRPGVKSDGSFRARRKDYGARKAYPYEEKQKHPPENNQDDDKEFGSME